MKSPLPDTAAEATDSQPATGGTIGLAAVPLFAFFRDKDLSMTSEGMPYQPAGIVTDKYGEGCTSGKDLVVVFIDPFTLFIQRQWRAVGEIEMLVVDEWQWRPLKERYERREANTKARDRSEGELPPNSQDPKS